MKSKFLLLIVSAYDWVQEVIFTQFIVSYFVKSAPAVSLKLIEEFNYCFSVFIELKDSHLKIYTHLQVKPVAQPMHRLSYTLEGCRTNTCLITDV